MKAQVTTAVAMFAILATARPCNAEPEPKPEVKLVVVIDNSGTYRKRGDEAVKTATRLLSRLANRTVKRWRKSGYSIVVIALDALPEVIFRANLEKLKSADGEATWVRRLKRRSDMTRCTDVVGAIRLAASHLSGDRHYVSKHLLIFSDLLHEPPDTSVRSCAKKEHVAKEFPFPALQDVDTHVMWMPPDQMLRWRRAVENAGLADRIKLHSDAESGAVTLEPPRPPEVSAAVKRERRAQRKEKVAQVTSTASDGFQTLLLAAAVVVLLLVAAAKFAPSRRSDGEDQ